MSRPDSPLRNNLSDDETIKKLKLMLIKEKRINKENFKIIGDLTKVVETKTNENEQLICQIQRLSQIIGSLEDNESGNLEKILAFKTEKLTLNKKTEELQLLILEKDKIISNLNDQLNLIYGKLELPVFDHFEDMVSVLENKIKVQSDSFEFYKTIESENLDLKNKIIFFEQKNENKFELLKHEYDEISETIIQFKKCLCSNFNDLVSTNISISPKVLLNDEENLSDISNKIMSCLKNIVIKCNNEKESNNLLQDGFDKILIKCNNLENVIECQNNVNHKTIELELEQKDEQIKRLEELIEDNRNISRALETERDQLQNDLVDLRQRHEEKEGYLMDEYREAKQNLESYRIFNDKESAYKINEIERLRKLLDEYQQEMNQVKFMNDCRFCRQFELLTKTLKERFDIVDESFCHEDIIGKIIEKFECIETLFDRKINEFQKNEILYRNNMEKMQHRLQTIEKTIENNIVTENQLHELHSAISNYKELINLLNEEMQDDKKIIDLSNIKFIELNELKSNLENNNKNFQEIFDKILELLKLDNLSDHSLIIDRLKFIVNQSEQFMRDIDQYKSEIDKFNYKQINLIEEKNIEETKHFQNQLEELHLIINDDKQRIDLLQKEKENNNTIIELSNFKFKEINDLKLCLEKEKKNFKELIDKIMEILNMDKNSNDSVIIDRLEFTVNQSKELIQEINQYKLQVEKFNEKLSIIEDKKIEELHLTNVNYKEQINSLQKEIQDNRTDFDLSNIKFMETQELKLNLEKENKSFKELIDKIMEILNIDKNCDNTVMIDKLTFTVNQSYELIKEIDKYKSQIDKSLVEEKKKEELYLKNVEYKEQINSLQKEVQNNKENTDLMNGKFMEINEIKLNLEEENKTYKELIDKIIEILNIDKNCNDSVIIDRLEFTVNQSKELIQEIKQYKLQVENFNEKLNIIEEKKIEELHLTNIDYKEQINSLQKEIQDNKTKFDLSNEQIVQSIKLRSVLEIENKNHKELIDKVLEILNINMNNDKSSIIDKLQLVINESDKLRQETDQYKLDLKQCNDKIDNLSNENVKLTEQLIKMQKDFSGNDLMNLEMAEFDKTLVNLNHQLLLKTNQIEDFENILKSKETIINSFQEQIQHLDSQNSFLEERSNKMKQLLVKTKRNLADCKTELEQLKTVKNTDNEQMESLINQLEETKFQLSEVFKEKEKLKEHYSTMSKKLETISKNKDLRLTDLRSQLDFALNNNQSLQREFDLYKIKAQNALSTQQRPKPTFSNFMTTELTDSSHAEDIENKDFKKMVKSLEVIVNDLKIEIQESEDKVFSLNNELDNMRWENEKWIEKYKILMKENNDLNQKLQEIFQETQESDKIQKNSYSNLMDRFEIEKENIVKNYLSQMETSKSNFESKINDLEKRLLDVESEKIKYQEEVWSCREQLRNAENKSNQINYSTENLTPTMKYQPYPINFKTALEHERQQGEGMETSSEMDDADSINNQIFSPAVTTKTRNYNNTFLSLDKLLNSGDEDSKHLLKDQITLLTNQSLSYKRKIENLNEILNDSEVTVARLTEQATILKSEIRRLEKNKDRDSKLKDEPTHEYLKNIIMKFFDYETKIDDRSQLVPVLVTLLSLNLDEKEKLVTFTKLIQFDRKQNLEGWTNYFNWTGNS